MISKSIAKNGEPTKKNITRQSTTLTFISEQSYEACLSLLEQLNHRGYAVDIYPIDSDMAEFSIALPDEPGDIQGTGTLRGWAGGEQTRVVFKAKEPGSPLDPTSPIVPAFIDMVVKVGVFTAVYGLVGFVAINALPYLFTSLPGFFLMILAGFVLYKTMAQVTQALQSGHVPVNRRMLQHRKRTHHLYDIIVHQLG